MTKTDLLTELLARYLETCRNSILQTMDEAKPEEEGLRTFIQVVLSEEDSDEIKLALAIVSCAEEEALVNQLDAFYGVLYAILADFLSRIAENRLSRCAFKKQHLYF